MPTVAPASARDLDDYRERADRFIATLDEEYYLHFAGHKERLELEASRRVRRPDDDQQARRSAQR
jgi:hypothetical protein